MKNVMIGCFCAVCAIMVTGCKSAQKIERGIRHAAADEVVRYLEKKKVEFVDEPCENKDQYFDVIAVQLRDLIVKE